MIKRILLIMVQKIDDKLLNKGEVTSKSFVLSNITYKIIKKILSYSRKNYDDIN